MLVQASRLCTVRQARIQLAAVLTFAVVYNAPKFAEVRVELQVDALDNSTWLEPIHTALGSSRLYNVLYGNVFYTVFMLVVPLVVLAVLNVRLIREVKALGRRRLEMRRKNSRQAQDNNVTIVLIVVVLVFIVCQTPALVTQIWSPMSMQSCLWVQLLRPNPTQPNPTEPWPPVSMNSVNLKLYNFLASAVSDPRPNSTQPTRNKKVSTQHNPTEPNPWAYPTDGPLCVNAADLACYSQARPSFRRDASDRRSIPRLARTYRRST